MISFCCNVASTASLARCWLLVPTGTGPGVGRGSNHGSRITARDIGMGVYSFDGSDDKMDNYIIVSDNCL